MAGGGLRAQELVIGAVRLDVLPDHKVEEETLGREGPFAATWADWGQGLLTAVEGIHAPPEARKYLSARGVDASFPQQAIAQSQLTKVLPGWTSPPLKFVDFQGRSYTAVGSHVWRSNAGDLTVWNDVYTAAATISDIIAWGGYIIIARGAGYDYSATGAAASWTAVATAADYFAALNQQLWRAVKPNSLFFNTLVITAPAWSSSTLVGEAGYNITSVVGLEQVLLVGKEDGVYTLDQDGNPQQLTPELRLAPSSNNAHVKASCTFNGDYYFRTNLGLLNIEGQGGLKDRVGFDELASPDLPTTRILALTQDGKFLYALCDTSGAGADLRNISIYRRTVGGAWHLLYLNDALGATANDGRAGALGVTGMSGYPQVLVAYQQTTAPTWAIGILTVAKFANPLQDSSYVYDTDVATKWLRLPRIFSPFGRLTIDRIQVIARGLTANRYLQVYVSVDGAASALFGGVNIAANPGANLLDAITGNYFDVYINFVSEAGGSPVLEGISIQGFYRSGRRKRHTYEIIGDTYHDTRRGGDVRVAPETLIPQLQTLRDTNTFSDCEDEYGVAFKALVTHIGQITTKNVLAEDGTKLSARFQVVLEQQATA